MNSIEEVKVLMDCMKNLAQCSRVTPKELLYCKELYSEVKVLCLDEEPKTEREIALKKSGAKITENIAILSLKIRIKNLMESML